MKVADGARRLQVPGFCSFTGEVILERREQMPDDRNAPGPAQQPLPGAAAHVRHVRVVNWESKDPEETTVIKSIKSPYGRLF